MNPHPNIDPQYQADVSARLARIEAALWGVADQPGLVGHVSAYHDELNAIIKRQSWQLRLLVLTALLLLVHLVSDDRKWLEWVVKAVLGGL